MLGVGLLGGLVLATLMRPVARIAARRKANQAARRMRDAVAVVAQALVLDPVRDVLGAYVEANAAVRSLRSRRRGSR
jgi:hypothetical protein